MLKRFTPKNPLVKTAHRIGKAVLEVRYIRAWSPRNEIKWGITVEESYEIGENGYISLKEAIKLKDWLDKKAIPTLEKMSKEDYEKLSDKSFII